MLNGVHVSHAMLNGVFRAYVASMQSDQGVPCLQTKSLDTKECSGRE